MERRLFASRGVSCSYVSLRGIHYSTKTYHRGNSQIMLKSGGRIGGSPAIIEYIVIVQDTKAIKTLIGVQRMEPFRAKHDPFSLYPFLHLSLHAYHAGNRLEFVPLDDIHCHFASLEVCWEGQPATVVTSLDRG